jgi:RNA polymerase sigma-70 factor (ECF subfamily)
VVTTAERPGAPPITDNREAELACVRRARAGDQRAFCTLVQRYQTPVFNLCYRLLGRYDEAEDAAQETFLRAFARLNTYDESHKFSSWLLSIGSHHCIDLLRRRRFTWLDIDDLSATLPSQSRDDQPEQVTLRNEAEETIQRLLGALPPDYRTIVVLYYWHQLSYEEIGDVLKISEPAVKSRLHRARRALADKLSSQPAAQQSLQRASAVGT